MAFLLAVPAADVPVDAVAAALAAVSIAGPFVVDLFERQLAVTTADEVDLLKLFFGEQICRAAGQHIRPIVGYQVDQRFFHLTGCDASGQRSEGIFHVDSLQLGSVGLLGLHDLGPDWVSEACLELLALKEVEGVLDALALILTCSEASAAVALTGANLTVFLLSG